MAYAILRKEVSGIASSALADGATASVELDLGDDVLTRGLDVLTTIAAGSLLPVPEGNASVTVSLLLQAVSNGATFSDDPNHSFLHHVNTSSAYTFADHVPDALPRWVTVSVKNNLKAAITSTGLTAKVRWVQESTV